MSMARLLRAQGDSRPAHDILAPVYGWFTQGFDTLDLRQAKLLLDELGEEIADHRAECDGDLVNRSGLPSQRRKTLWPIPVDLVARAFAILDQDKMRNHVRFLEGANIASESATPSVSLEPAPAGRSSHCNVASSAMEQSVFCPSAISTFNALSPLFSPRRIERPSS